MMFNQGLRRPTSDNNPTVHALMSANIQLLVRLMYSPEVVILVNQSTKDVKRLVIIPLSLVRSFIVVRLHPYEQVSLSINYKRKTWVLSSACSSSRPTTALTVNRQRNTHAGEYSTPVKCALRILDPRSTLRRVYTTPRGRHLCNVLDRSSIVVVSKTQNKA